MAQRSGSGKPELSKAGRWTLGGILAVGNLVVVVLAAMAVADGAPAPAVVLLLVGSGAVALVALLTSTLVEVIVTRRR